MEHDARYDALDQILDEVYIEFCPPEFVKAAVIHYLDGSSQMVDIEEAEKIFNEGLPLAELDIENIKLILDVRATKKAITQYAEEILAVIPV